MSSSPPVVPGTLYWDGTAKMWDQFVKQYGGWPERIVFWSYGNAARRRAIDQRRIAQSLRHRDRRSRRHRAIL